MKSAPSKIRKHYAIDVSQKSLDKNAFKKLQSLDWLIQESGGAGFLFSELTLQNFLDEEYRHSKKTLTTEEEFLVNKSSGERKKLLLDYQLNLNPPFLILDNPFEALDVERVAWFKRKLELVSKSTTLIQLYRRHEDLLPFLNSELIYEDGIFKEVPLKVENIKNESAELSHHPIPQAITSYENIPESLIKFENVSVSFDDKPVLSGITWEVKRGEFWHLKGPNGAGKTTLLSMISGDSTKGYGKELYIFGKKKGTGESVWEIKKRIGFFTNHLTERFDGMHTVLEMIVSGFHDSVGMYRKPTTLELAVAEEWSAFIGLKSFNTKRFRDLDEVQKRLVLIARAMVKQPPLLILDEPTGALNNEDAGLIVALINKITASGQTAVIYVSHRAETNLKFQYTFRLTASELGSTGETIV